MPFRLILLLAMVAWLLPAASHVRADMVESFKDPHAADPAQNALAAEYWATVFAGYADGLKKLLHPACRAAINKQNRDYFDHLFAEELTGKLDVGYFARSYPVRQEQLEEAAATGKFPVLPTHTIHLDWLPGANKPRNRILFAAKKDEKWFWVLPVPSAETLREFRAKPSAESSTKP